MRDVSINLYYRGRYIAKMIQVGKYGNDENCKEYGGENQTYSFVVEAKSIRKVYGTFMYAPNRENSEEYEFDEIRLKYYDEKGRKPKKKPLTKEEFSEICSKAQKKRFEKPEERRKETVRPSI